MNCSRMSNRWIHSMPPVVLFETSEVVFEECTVSIDVLLYKISIQEYCNMNVIRRRESLSMPRWRTGWYDVPRLCLVSEHFNINVSHETCLRYIQPRSSASIMMNHSSDYDLYRCIIIVVYYGHVLILNGCNKFLDNDVAFGNTMSRHKTPYKTLCTLYLSTNMCYIAWK